jgi:O-antigen/teichoic acid export membrane protein
MSVLRNNIIANYLGTTWISLFSLLLIPFYFRVLGPEAYGLVGFFIAFRASLTILDFGLSTYSTREIARRSSNLTSRAKSVGSYIRTIELVYWFFGILLFLIFAFVSFFFPAGWFKLNELMPNVVQASQLIFAITLGVSWPISFYRGILRGLERQVEYNYVAAFAATFRGVASFLVLLFISPTVIASLVEMLLMRKMVWHSIGKKGIYEISYAKFRLKELISAWRGIAGITLVSILGILITQADKLIISRQLALEHLGYYTIAVTLASSTSRLVDSIIVAIFPKFASTHIQGKHETMEKIYENSSKLVILIYLPVLFCSMFFSEQLLFLWTNSESVSIIAGEILALLIAAQLFAKLCNISSNFQLAAGKIRLLIWINVIAFIIYLPILLFTIENFGAKGAAISWLLINFAISIFLGFQIKAKAVHKIMSYQWLFNISKVLIPTVVLFTTIKSFNLPPFIN